MTITEAKQIKLLLGGINDLGMLMLPPEKAKAIEGLMKGVAKKERKYYKHFKTKR